MPEEIRLVDVGLIDLPKHVRQHDSGKVDELAQDMKEIGQLQDIVVAKKGEGRYELIAGQGRLLAAKRLNWAQIRCLAGRPFRV
ncbi:MAG: ParB N-terminal domain-containing protein [Elusimicrobia bacterium]|nr:ParB N-terminal domain-containing protein [Candidatus Liberimonas magnetica]